MSEPAIDPADPSRQALDRASNPRPKRGQVTAKTKRKPIPMWDRLKIFLLLIGVFGLLMWGAVADNPVLQLTWQASPWDGFVDTFRLTVQGNGWLLVLAGLEFLRQLHYLVCERSAGYNTFWGERVLSPFRRMAGRMSDWDRFRIARVFKVILFLVVLSVILSIIFDKSPLTALFEVPALIIAGAPFIMQLAFAFFFVIFQFVGLFWFLSRGGIDTYMPDDLDTRFTDVKGQDAVLDRVKESMIFLEDPDTIEAHGGYVPNGILLWGPPGTGKTLMAQAVAGETAKPFVFVDPGAFTAMFMGVGILKVKGLYRKLRRLAVRYGGVLVFFDEADSLGNRGSVGGTPGGAGGGWGGHEALDSPWTTGPACNGLGYVSEGTRSHVFADSLGTPGAPGPGRIQERMFMGGMAGGGGMGTLQALLSEMSGLVKPRGFFNRYVRRLLGMKPKPPPKYRILHMFATNMPQSLDEAMLRPGRIDRLYKVGYPHKEGRKETFHYYLDDVQHEISDDQVDKLATMSPYATGASIKDMVNEGLIIAIRDDRDAITYADITKAKQLKEHGLPDDHQYIKREQHSVAVHEACHAVVAYRLRRHAIIDMATIERRGDVGGFVSSIPPEDQFVEWRSERDVDVMTFLASLAGERMFYDGDNSAGVGGDMRGATSIVTLMEGFQAMGETIASHSVTKFSLTRGRSAMGAEDGQDRNLLETELGRRVEAKLQELYGRTWDLLAANRAEVLAVAHALEYSKTVTGDDIAAVIEGRQGPLVDGRPYHDPAFVAALESYHQRALEAHAEHAPIESVMPVPEMAGSTTAPQLEIGGNGHTRSDGPPPRPDDD